MRDYVLIIFATIIIIIAFLIYMLNTIPTKSACKKDDIVRGDRLFLITTKEKTRNFYKGCEIIFLASQATQRNNVAFVLLKDCDFQTKFPEQWDNPTTDMFNMSDLAKAIE